MDASGRYSFQRIVPWPELLNPDAFMPLQLDNMKFEPVGDMVADAAHEVNGNAGVPNGAIVKMTFSGYDPEGNAVFTFNVPPTDWQIYLPPHDHRDNLNGGYAFACFHPGTSIPMMPYAI